MIEDACVPVKCDVCYLVEYIPLTKIAGGWDERGVTAQLKQLGWLISDAGEIICDTCVEDYKRPHETLPAFLKRLLIK